MILTILMALLPLMAEMKAENMWSKQYRNEPGCGAVWYNTEMKQWYVGISDGKVDKPGKGGFVIADQRQGGFRNMQWTAEFASPSGGFYKNQNWFGRGDTLTEAFKDSWGKGFR